MSHYPSKAEELSAQITPPVEPVEDAAVAGPAARDVHPVTASSPGLKDAKPSETDEPESESSSDAVLQRLRKMWPTMERRG